MKLHIIAMGHKMPSWVQAGIDEYTKRMPAESRIDLIELKPEDRASRAIPKVLALEAARIKASIPKGSELIVLDERGAMVKTTELAGWLRSWMANGVSPCFVIGSADGLDPALKQIAKKTIALSGCTLPHGFARLILVEQLYRAWSLTENHPYHRE